jgi:hypothetical protein
MKSKQLHARCFLIFQAKEVVPLFDSARTFFQGQASWEQ